jgi:hypothetical protein
MRHQEFYEYLKNKKPEDLTEFEKDLLRDWGNPDIYGPWTEPEINLKPGVFKFHKSYYLVDFANEGNEQTKIDSYENRNG